MLYFYSFFFRIKMCDEEQVRACFDKFDADNSGTVTALELIKVLRELPNCEGDSQAADQSVVSNPISKSGNI